MNILHNVLYGTEETESSNTKNTFRDAIFKLLLFCIYRYAIGIYWPVWLSGWVFVYELSGCGFESSYSHLNFRFRACFEQGVPWHSGAHRVWIHSETPTWHDKNIKSKKYKGRCTLKSTFFLHLLSYRDLFITKNRSYFAVDLFIDSSIGGRYNPLLCERVNLLLCSLISFPV